jgi:Ala-tRNA(Pro) deacylase
MADLYRFLEENDIKYERHDHPPVYTVEDVERLVPVLPAARTKNLFFRDNKGRRHFLVVLPAEKRVDRKTLSGAIGSSRLSFGSAERLKKHLGVDPGAVSIFAVFNDSDRAVEVIIDEALWKSEAFQFHPLTNTSTLVIRREDLSRFLVLTGHEARRLAIPAQE